MEFIYNFFCKTIKKIISYILLKHTMNKNDDVLGESSDVPATMHVISTVEHPVAYGVGGTSAKWILRNEGILSKDSTLSFQLLVPDSLDKKGFLPINCGIWCLIKEARLSIGGRRLHDLHDLAYFRAMTESYNTPSFRTNRVRLLRGINNCMIPTAVGPTDSNAGTFVPAGGKLVSETECEQDYQMQLRSNESDSPEWSIPLHALFPILSNIELPLYLLKDEVVIELVFNTQPVGSDKAVGGVGTLCCFENSALNTPVHGACSLLQSSCLLFQDTIYYNNEKVEEISKSVNAKDGFFLDYTDILQNVSNHAALSPPITIAGENGTQNNAKNDRVAVSGHRIKNLFWGWSANSWQSSTAPVSNPPWVYYDQWCGKYKMNATQKPSTFDIRLNDQLLLAEPMSSETQKAMEARNVYDSPVWLNQSLYGYNSQVDKPGADGTYPVNPLASQLPNTDYKLWGGYQDATYLAGGQHFCAVHLGNVRGSDLDDSTLVSSKPIEILHSEIPLSSANNFNRTCRYYAECVKKFGVADGKAMVFEGPAVVAAV